MIKMGMAAAHDFKLYLPMLCLLMVGLAAACKFTGNGAPTGKAAPVPSLGG